MRAKDILNEDWQKVNKKDKTDGMSRKAVNAYRRENPGSKLKTAVTTKPSKLKKGSKASKRRSSYCSRSKGQMDMHNISCAKTPDKAICKARRRWNCEEDIQQVEQALEEAKKTLKNSNPCWKGYKPVGTKKKGGRTVPNCVPTNEDAIGTAPKRPKRVGSRPDRGHEAQPRYKNAGISKDAETTFHAKLDKLVHNTFGKRDDEMAEGKTQKQEAPKPRNFVAKNAVQSGAGAHKDKKKAEKQGDVKHKGKMLDLAEMESVLGEHKKGVRAMKYARKPKNTIEPLKPKKPVAVGQEQTKPKQVDEHGKASRELCKSSKPDHELGASMLASCKSQGLRARDGNKSHKLGKTAKSRVKVGGHKIKGRKYGGPLPDWS